MKSVNLLRLPVFAILCLGLTACGSDSAQNSTTTTLKAAIVPMFSSLFRKSNPASTGLGLTRAALATVKTPIDLVTIESRKAQGVIALVATNRDVETWSSADSKSLSFRDGVLIATRGLGDDLMSASAPRLAQIKGPTAQYSRVHTVLDGQDKPVILRYDCTTTRSVDETITIVERSYRTRPITETCSGPDGGFTNQYWVEANGNLRKSRQWVSKTIKYVVIEHLKE